MNSIIKRIFACVAFAVSTAASGANAAFFTGLGDLPGGEFKSWAFGISGDGSTVVGFGTSASGREAFRWTAGSGMVGLGSFSSHNFGSQAEDVSADGSVIVGRAGSEWGMEAFRWTEESGTVGLGDLPGGPMSSSAFDVSGNGAVVVGESYSVTGLEAFRWSLEGGMTGLGHLPGGNLSRAFAVSPDGSFIVGYATTPRGPEAYRWTAENGMVGLGDLPGGSFGSGAEDVSLDGVVVGASIIDSPSVWEAFRWTDEDGMVGLGDLPGGAFGSLARGVSANGSIIVGQSTTDTGAEAFIWDSTTGIQSLQDLLIDRYGLGASLSGWRLLTAWEVSDDGRVFVGIGVNPTGYEEAYIANIRTLPGDTNFDGRISLDDLNNVRNHFGDTGPADGTLTGDAYPFDGQVNIDDINAVLNNFGVTSAPVPEPAAGLVYALGVTAVLGRVRRRCRYYCGMARK